MPSFLAAFLIGVISIWYVERRVRGCLDAHDEPISTMDGVGRWTKLHNDINGFNHYLERWAERAERAKSFQ